MNPLQLIEKYYDSQGEAYSILTLHSRLVADKSITIAKNNTSLNINIDFIAQAAMLHDIGVFLTNAPEIDCHGSYPYISHGYLGADILRKEGYPIHALVCERHTGTGLTLDEIKMKNLPVPPRDMLPISLEEQLICFSDKFFSKTNPQNEKSIEEVRLSLSKFGLDSVAKFDAWCILFL